jgi:tRNA modification GTPase
LILTQIHTEDTIIAPITANGIGAVSIIRISGKDAISVTEKFFHGKKLSKQASHTIHFGTIRNEQNRILDEVLISLFKNPKSYTGEDSIEISCHGSPYIQQQVLELFLNAGVRMANPGEFTMRAFLNGKLDLSQAEAVAELIASQSEASHKVALHQLRGGFSNELSKLREELINFASLIELELDFGEEDVEFVNREQLRLLVEKIQYYVQQLLRSFQLGNAIKNGVTTVIAGRPNAGKSTLLNTLLNEERAIVSDIAGTTRDTIEETLNINGVLFRLIDTAGIREAQDQIEAIGVQKTLEKVRQAAILVYLWDVNQMKIREVLEDIEKLQQEDMKLLVVCNKIDKNPSFDIEWLLNPLSETIPSLWKHDTDTTNDFNAFYQKMKPLQKEQVLSLSAKDGLHIGVLKEKLLQTLANGNLNLENTIITNARHYEALQRAQTALTAVLDSLAFGVTTDFVAMDIRRSLYEIGSITGHVDVEDLLANIFSKFCIGK